VTRLGKVVRWAPWVALALFAALQFKQVDHSNPPVRTEVDAPADVAAILRRSCYDCHSHQTRWPWYSYVAPMSWFVADHVEHGRGDLNFSEWPLFDLEERQELLEEVVEQVSAGEMPLTSYLWLHPGARLSDADKARLLVWAAGGAPDGVAGDDD